MIDRAGAIEARSPLKANKDEWRHAERGGETVF